MSAGPSRSLMGAALAFTLALFLFGSALLRAFSSDAVLLPEPASAPAADEDGVPSENTALSSAALQLAVENDPFTPERQPPAERYRLPGDVDPEPEPAPQAPPPPPPPPAFRVTGTLITENSSMALISVGDVPPRMMTVGESLMGYQLSGVTAETATMTNEDNNIVLRVPTPSRVASGNARGAPQRGAQPQRPGQSPQQQGAMIQQIMERARQAGATPQMIESIMRMVGERGLSAIENLEIGPNGFTVRGNGGTMRMETRVAPAPPGGPGGTMIRPRPDTTELRMPRAPDLR